jgi:hypothetical protein
LDLEEFAPIFMLLFAVGIIFGTFVEWQANPLTPFGWTWFINMLWFAIGFPVLILIGLLLFAFGIKGYKLMKEK